MKTAVGGIVVFILAVRAHGETLHCGEWPVVRESANDSESRPAVCAVDERVKIAAVLTVKKLMQAVIAYAHIR